MSQSAANVQRKALGPEATRSGERVARLASVFEDRAAPSGPEAEQPAAPGEECQAAEMPQSSSSCSDSLDAGERRQHSKPSAGSEALEHKRQDGGQGQQRARPSAGPDPLERKRQVVDESYQLEKTLLKELRPNGSEQGSLLRRSTTMGPANSQAKELSSNLRAPNGFRRHFLNQQAAAAGIPEEKRPGVWRKTFMDTVRPLLRVGYFDNVLSIHRGTNPDEMETVASGEGKSGVWQTSFALLKSFIGSGVTFLPFAFSMGGWLFSTAVLLLIAVVSALCIKLLVECSVKSGASNFGDVAHLAGGRLGRLMVQVSLVMGQFGTCIAYMIFVSQLAESLGPVSRMLVIILQFIVLVPLCNLRSVHLLEYPNLFADVLIFFGLLVVIVDMFRAMGRGDNHCLPFKHSTYGIFIGTAVFTFEGIPMMLPIRNAMQEPDRFMAIFARVFTIITMTFVLIGLLGYVGYGTKSELVVLLNLPKRSALTSLVKFSYMVALVLGLPLMFLPAARITEYWALGIEEESYGSSKKESLSLTQIVRRESGISLMRFAEVCLFAVVAYKGDAFFATFLAVVGATCCAPVAFVYPSLFHLILAAETKAEKLIDVSILLFGAFAVGLTLWQTF